MEVAETQIKNAESTFSIRERVICSGKLEVKPKARLNKAG
jgi:hypothetical protein